MTVPLVEAAWRFRTVVYSNINVCPLFFSRTFISSTMLLLGLFFSLTPRSQSLTHGSLQWLTKKKKKKEN